MRGEEGGEHTYFCGKSREKVRRASATPRPSNTTYMAAYHVPRIYSIMEYNGRIASSTKQSPIPNVARILQSWDLLT